IHPQHLTALLSKYASDDALFTADGGSPMVWVLRHIRVNGRRRTLTSLLHGTMANAMPQALGLQKAFPGRQVISLSGDGGLAMLLGDLLTAVQENLPIKVVVFNNGSLNFVELEQKVEGLLDNYTDLKNPDFGRLAEVIGFHGRTVTRSEDLEEAVQDFLSQRGPALLDVHTSRAELVMPPQIEAKQVAGTALYAAKAVLNGRFGPYISDGRMNGKIPKDREPASLTLAEVQQLMEETGKPVRKGFGAKKAAAKKAPAKKAAVKKEAAPKKAAAKKAPAKKAAAKKAVKKAAAKKAPAKKAVKKAAK
ncbi:MAG: thiamine pyrophosphate-dependent enzyme, partial [Stenotrophomonas maltophilia]|nr:thiamine pyrophosphate-dependent enzyme [Stenotrophomonas maltophilia]